MEFILKSIATFCVLLHHFMSIVYRSIPDVHPHTHYYTHYTRFNQNIIEARNLIIYLICSLVNTHTHTHNALCARSLTQLFVLSESQQYLFIYDYMASPDMMTDVSTAALRNQLMCCISRYKKLRANEDPAAA